MAGDPGEEGELAVCPSEMLFTLPDRILPDPLFGHVIDGGEDMRPPIHDDGSGREEAGSYLPVLQPAVHLQTVELTG